MGRQSWGFREEGTGCVDSAGGKVEVITLYPCLEVGIGTGQCSTSDGAGVGRMTKKDCCLRS